MTGKSASVYAVIYLGEDAVHDLFHLVALLFRPQVGGVGAVKFTPFEKEVVGDPREVVGDHRAAFNLDHRGDGNTARIVRVALEIGLLQPLDSQNRIDPALI